MQVKGSIEISGAPPPSFDDEQAELQAIEAELMAGLRQLGANLRQRHQEITAVVVGSIEVLV